MPDNRSQPSPPSGVMARFFYGDCSLDRPRVDIEIESLPDLLGQLARSNGLARDQLLLDKCQHRTPYLVRAAWTPLPGHQAGDPCFLEAGFGLIVRRPGHAVFLRRTGHRRALHRYAAQHLVLDLHDVARIEELAIVELRILDLPGRRIQRALFEQGPDLGMLAVAFGGHRDLRGSACRSLL